MEGVDADYIDQCVSCIEEEGYAFGLEDWGCYIEECPYGMYVDYEDNVCLPFDDCRVDD